MTTRLDYFDDDTNNVKGFKTKLDNNIKGLSIPDINQAFAIRRMDMFQNIGAESFLTRMDESMPHVIDFKNYKDQGNIANIPIRSHLLGTGDEVRMRNGLYSRVGYPASDKRNWADMSNNFRIFKIINNDGGHNKYVEFPKSVRDNDLNTIVSFTSIDIDFEGTYIDTARSDVSVKVRLTLDNFSLLEPYYSSKGELYGQNPPEFKAENVDPVGSFYQNYVRFLDLLQPPEIQSMDGFPNKGILLDVYANHPRDPDANLILNEDYRTAFRNHLQLKLYIVDHTLSFNETTNKVDIEIEYRASADIPIFDKDPAENILYMPSSKEELKRLLNTRKEQVSNGCKEAAGKTTEEINKIEKWSLKDRVRFFETSWDGLGGYFRVERYEYTNQTDLAKSNDVIDSGGQKGLESYGGNFYIPSLKSYSCAGELLDHGYPEEHRSDYWISLHSLLVVFLPLDSNNIVTNSQVYLPYVPIQGPLNDSFQVGDLPINMNSFEDWFNKRYIKSNIYYLDYKTLVKDIILNYVNVYLRYAFFDYETKPALGVNISNDVGSNETFDNCLTNNRVLWSERDKLGFYPKRDRGQPQGKDWVNIIVYNNDGEDFFACPQAGNSDVYNKLKQIANSHIVIEAKSAYGPFKNLKLSRNDSGYIREIRSVQQEISDISQLGAVYDATLETHQNCPDFRFFPGEMCYLYIPEFGLSFEKSNLAYKLGIGGNQIITKVSHKIELEGAAKMTTSIVMRYWGSGTTNTHKVPLNRAGVCPDIKESQDNNTEESDIESSFWSNSGIGGR